MLIKPIFLSFLASFKKGLYLAADSFKLLFMHPELLSYYALLLIAQCITFIFAYNIIGYQTSFLDYTNDFQIPSNNLLTDIVPVTGGLIYIGLLCSIFMAIFLRNFAGAALVNHTNTLINGQPAFIKHSLLSTYNKLSKIIAWTGLVTLVTFITQLVILLPDNLTIIFLLIAFDLLWSTATFFVLPIITLENRSLLSSIEQSARCIMNTIVQVCGGVLWFIVLYIISFSTLHLVQKLLPMQISDPIAYAGFFALNALGSQVLLVFKDKLYKTYLKRNALIIEEESAVDFSQF